MTMEVLIIFLMIYSKTATGLQAVYFQESSLIPDNEEHLIDHSLDTCTDFTLEIGINIPTHTMLRIEVVQNIRYYAIVTLFGTNLGCGHDLYVVLLMTEQTTQWTGRWKTCRLQKESVYEGKEVCWYGCQCSEQCDQVQILKRPFTVEGSTWSLCDIYVWPVYPGCNEIPNKPSGFYLVRTTPYSSGYIHRKALYCDMETDGGGWTVLLRRIDGSENFYREWNVYKAGFGSLKGEFWAGTEFIHRLTNDGRTYTLRVDLTNYAGESVFAKYGNFSVGPESDSYTLHVSEYDRSSTADNSLPKHDGCMFSTGTIDNDNIDGNLAQIHETPWWFCNVSYVALTGRYGEMTNSIAAGKGIRWVGPWSPNTYAKYVVMMIRPN